MNQVEDWYGIYIIPANKEALRKKDKGYYVHLGRHRNGKSASEMFRSILPHEAVEQCVCIERWAQSFVSIMGFMEKIDFRRTDPNGGQ
jgi:hypothetical protein